MKSNFRLLELGGGVVTEATAVSSTTTTEIGCWLPPVAGGYADAQFDDYGLPAPHGRHRGRGRYRWRPGTTMRLEARFSHGRESLLGTAGFGFWNAPFADPSVRWPALPQAVWFFFASPPSDLPLAAVGPGRGWFAATLDAGQGTAVSLAPLAPMLLLLNRWPSWQQKAWPILRQRLGISFAPVPQPMTGWHSYELTWQRECCAFRVDGDLVLRTNHSPRGPLGFVCWLDNQFMVATNDGRFRWGVLPIPRTQWLAIRSLQLSPSP